MAKTKITALTTLADGSIAIGDLIPIVDVDDFSQAASGTTKKVTITSLASAVATAFSGDSPTFVNLNTTGTTTLGDSGDATTVNGTLGVTGATTLSSTLSLSNATTPNITLTQTATHTEGPKIQFIDYQGRTFIVRGTSPIAEAYIGTTTNHQLDFGTGNTTRMTIATSGAVTIAGTLGVTGVATFTDNIAMASGKGIDFSATANSSGTMTSEILSDYEEGTWTPSFVASTTNPTVAYSEQTGIYTKVGRVVYWSLRIITSSVSGGSGNLKIDGLPFTISGSHQSSGVTFSFNWNTAAQTTFSQATSLLLQTNITGNVNSEPSHLNVGSNYFYAGGFYFV